MEAESSTARILAIVFSIVVFLKLNGFTAILIMTFTAFKSPVILAGMPVSSHRDVKPQGDGNAKSSTYALSKLPSMALDFGIPAKMTAHIAIMRIADGFKDVEPFTVFESIVEEISARLNFQAGPGFNVKSFR
jgi:hypothetical protein